MPTSERGDQMAASASGVKLTLRGEDVDLTIYQGKTINFSLIWGGNTPVNVTGWSARLTVRNVAPDTPGVAADFTVANSRVVVGTTDGKFTFKMTATDCAGLVPTKNALWDCELTDTNGNVFQGQSGKAYIVGEQAK